MFRIRVSIRFMLLSVTGLCIRATGRGVPFLLVAVVMTGSYAHCQETGSDLDVLLQQRRYIELQAMLAKWRSQFQPSDLAYFDAVLANRTNQVETSAQLLESLLPALSKNKSARTEIALCTLADDYAKSFRYQQASNAYAEAARLTEEQEKESFCDAERESSRWRLLGGVAAQTVSGARSFTVVGKRDTLGLVQLPVTIRNYTGSWIVDTGASLSVISRSAANRMGLDTSTIADTAEGIALVVPVHTAVIREIRIGKAVLRNVAVLVVEDSDLTFPVIGYHIEGSLGLPVLIALGRVTFYPGAQLRFDREKHSEGNADSHNLFFEGSALLASADFGKGDQLFGLDTGALLTVLSAQFYRDSKGPLGGGAWAALELAGAGGTLVSPAYIVRNALVNLGGGCARVQNIPVLLESTGRAGEFYGNIGQSVLKSFSSVTLDFVAMRFTVSGGNVKSCPLGD
jgi:predicted aspartyl protease